MRIHFSKLFVFIVVLCLNSANTFAQADQVNYPPAWVKTGDPLNIHGSTGSWDQSVIVPCVIFNPDSNRFEMWYTAFWSYPNEGIGFAWSNDGLTWNKHDTAVMIPGSFLWETLFVGAVCVIRESGIYKMWYTGWNNTTRMPHYIGYATSPDGIVWTKHGDPVLSPVGSGWEMGAVGYPCVIKVSGGYWMFYTGEVTLGVCYTGRAFSTDGITWQRDTVNNPVLPAGSWDQNNYLPKVIQMNDSLYMCYTGESVPGNNSTSAIGFAKSTDMGASWTRDADPILTRGTSGNWDSGWIESGSLIYTPYELRLYYDGGGPVTNSKGRIGLAISAPISVELISFVANSFGNDVILNWTTATETNNSGFCIERKSFNSDYSGIGFVPGFGTTTESKSYSYTDYNVTAGKYTYRLKQIDFDGGYTFSPEVVVVVNPPLVFSLGQNYPNPFNPLTTVDFAIQTKCNVKISVINTIGEEVAVILNKEKEPGYYQVEFDASNLPSGVYFYQMKATPDGGQAGNFIQTKKMILLK